MNGSQKTILAFVHHILLVEKKVPSVEIRHTFHPCFPGHLTKNGGPSSPALAGLSVTKNDQREGRSEPGESREITN